MRFQRKTFVSKFLQRSVDGARAKFGFCACWFAHSDNKICWEKQEDEKWAFLLGERIDINLPTTTKFLFPADSPKLSEVSELRMMKHTEPLQGGWPR